MGDNRILVEFFVNDCTLFSNMLNGSQKLSEIRKQFNDKFKDCYKFLKYDGSELELADEEEIPVTQVLKNKKINLNCDDPKELERLKELSNKNKPPTKEIKLNVPIEGSKKLYNKNNLDIYLYPKEELTKSELENAIVLMVVGQTGSGKTTLLNAFINYLMGINYEDSFRYHIIYEDFNKTQDYSQTTEVNIYNIKPKNGLKPIQIIDTPGFGNKGGIKKDIEITQKIRQVFIDKLSSMTCICFVAQSRNARLSANQKYIFNCILDLFGDDVKSNFTCLLTFCDETKPVIIDSLQSKEFMFHEIIPYIENPWYYKFNNSGIFEKNLSNRSFFDLDMESFADFTKRINKLKKISLNKSKEVLIERQNLEKQIELLQKSLKEGIDKIENIKNIIKIIKSIKGNLDSSKNFTQKIKRIRLKKIPIYDRSATTCLICFQTCHDGCNCEDNEKYGCSAMTGDRNNAHCVVCPGKCHWSKHKNLPFIYEYEEYEETVTLNDLKKIYYGSKRELDTKTQLINGAKNDLLKLYKDCLKIQDLINKKINRLKEIALNKSVFATDEEYIDLLIQTEKSDMKPGYDVRIEELLMLKKQKKILREIYEKKNSQLIDIEKFISDLLENEHKIKDEN